MRSDQRGGARTEGTSCDRLDGAGLEPGIACAAFTAPILQIIERVGEVQPLGDSNGELVFVLQLLEDAEVLPIGIILDRSDAVLREVGKNEQEAFAPLLD